MSATSYPVGAAPAAPPASTTPASRGLSVGTPLTVGVVTAYLSVIVLIPLAAVVFRSTSEGWDGFWASVTTPQALAALRLSLAASLLVSLINAVFGTLIAWVLVRDQFPGKDFMSALIDLPFALPTIVAGLTLIAMYGVRSPVGINIAYSVTAVILALLFVTVPFVVRAVQPVLEEMDKEMEQAARALGAGGWTTFRLIVLPNLLPAILAGVGLGFARAIGEFGSVVLISGNIPFETEVAAVRIFSQVENDNVTAASAIAVVLLAISLAVLLIISVLDRWSRKHDE
ncbi:MAG: sulfate ABC transporter permease subunit CysT [Thermomicrobiales bacterium]